MCRIRGSHSGAHKEFCRYTVIWKPTEYSEGYIASSFRVEILSQGRDHQESGSKQRPFIVVCFAMVSSLASTLRSEATYSSETSIGFQLPTQHYIPEPDFDLNKTDCLVFLMKAQSVFSEIWTELLLTWVSHSEGLVSPCCNSLRTKKQRFIPSRCGGTSVHCSKHRRIAFGTNFVTPKFPDLLWRRWQQIPVKYFCLSTRIHGITSSKIVILIFTAVRTSDTVNCGM